MTIKNAFKITAFVLILLVEASEIFAGNRLRPDELKAPSADDLTGYVGEASTASKEIDIGPSDGLTSDDTAPPDGSKPFTLNDCIRLALARNARLKASGYDIDAAKSQYEEADAVGWPVVEYNYRIAPVPTDVHHALKTFFEGQVTLFNSIHVGLGIPVMTFGQLHTTRQMARGGVEAARINVGKLKSSTIHQIKQLYYGVQLAKELIKLLRDAVEKITDKIESEEEKEEKELDPYDILQLKITRVDLERRLEEANSNLELAMEGLRVQMDLEPGTPVELDSDNLRPILASLGKEEDYIAAGMSSHPDVRLMDIGVETRRLNYKLEKLKLMPSAGFGFFVDVGRAMGFIAGLNLTDDFNDPFNYTRAGVGVQIKGNIDFHGAYEKIRKARAEYYKASFDSLIGRRAMNLEIRKAYLNAKRAQEDVTRAKHAQSIAQQMTFLSKLNIDTGLGDNTKYGDALKLLLLTRGSYFKAVYDYNLSLSELSQRVSEVKYDELTPVPELEEYEVFDPKDMKSGEVETIEPNRTTIQGVRNDISIQRNE